MNSKNKTTPEKLRGGSKINKATYGGLYKAQRLRELQGLPMARAMQRKVCD